MVDRIGRQCPGVTVIATTREGLGIRGEHMIAVGSLPTDEAMLVLHRWCAEKPFDQAFRIAVTSYPERAARLGLR